MKKTYRSLGMKSEPFLSSLAFGTFPGTIRRVVSRSKVSIGMVVKRPLPMGEELFYQSTLTLPGVEFLNQISLPPGPGGPKSSFQPLTRTESDSSPIMLGHFKYPVDMVTDI